MGPRDWILRFRDDYKTRFFVRLGGNLEGGVKTSGGMDGVLSGIDRAGGGKR